MVTGTTLVTGATGFVGQALVARLRAAGRPVLALTRGEAPNRPDCLAFDLGSGGRLELPAGVTDVVHLAQSRVHRRFPEDAGDMFRVNVAGTQDLLDAAARRGVRSFCLVSSGSVYEPYSGPLAEHVPLAPTSYLGASKLAAECVARPYAGLFALSTLRLFVPYGPGQAGRLIPDLVRRVATGEPVMVGSDGEGMRFTPTHVDDVCTAILAALDGPWSGIFNVAAPGSLTIRDAAVIIGEAVGRAPTFSVLAQPALQLVPDLSRLAERVDVAAFRDFRTGLANLLAAPAPTSTA